MLLKEENSNYKKNCCSRNEIPVTGNTILAVEVNLPHMKENPNPKLKNMRKLMGVFIFQNRTQDPHDPY
jgi:hypothetical protein